MSDSERGLKANLKAANQEVESLMSTIKILKESDGRAAADMERKYAAKLANMAVMVRHLADQVAELAGRISQR